VLIQHYPPDRLPERLKPYRFVTHDRPVRGRFMCPSEDSLQGYVIPKFQEWVPQHLLLGKSWAKAYSKQHGVLHFADGGLMEFRTYKVDPATLVGADLDYVANDEPSPEAARQGELVASDRPQREDDPRPHPGQHDRRRHRLALPGRVQEARRPAHHRHPGRDPRQQAPGRGRGQADARARRRRSAKPASSAASSTWAAWSTTAASRAS
jgi:hypothetical protein